MATVTPATGPRRRHFRRFLMSSIIMVIVIVAIVDRPGRDIAPTPIRGDLPGAITRIPTTRATGAMVHTGHSGSIMNRDSV